MTVDAAHPGLAKIPPTRWPTRDEARASRLFSPIRLGPVTARARTWVPAMVPWRSVEEGFVTRDLLDWYGRFADGRPGVLVVEATGVRDVPSGPLLRIGHDRFVPGLRELVQVVRERSGGATRLFIQIIDFLSVKRRPEKEAWVRRFLKVRDVHRTRLGKTGDANEEEVRVALLALPHDEFLGILDPREVEEVEFGYRERVNDLHLPHVRELPRVLPGIFAAAAARAEVAGFDGVELHFAHAYTMAGFLSRLNVRDDGYGGTPANRVRLPLEVYRATRAAVGKGFAVGCRILSDEVIEAGSRVEDASFYAVELARAGIDFVSVSKGGKFEDAKQPKVGEAVYPYTGPSGLECMPTVKSAAPDAPFGRNLGLSHAIRSAVRAAGFETPIGGAGGVNSFELAERALLDGDCDFVGAARQSLADPDWWRKMEEGRGDEIRRCIYTNYCEGLDQQHKQVTCQLWDREDLSGDVRLSKDGKRRLVPPPWR
jgi:2,4-dienoyl-CoA reductase-like NADH-dependent reductase (Old Yellow Enzyme family)